MRWLWIDEAVGGSEIVLLKFFGEVFLGSSPFPIDDLFSWSDGSGKTTRRGEGDTAADVTDDGNGSDGMMRAGRGGAKWLEGESNRTPRSKKADEDEDEDEEEEEEMEEGEGGVRR